MSLATLITDLLVRGRFLGLRPAATAAGADDVVPATSGASGGLRIEGAAGGEPLPVSGTVIATVADAATETTLASILAKIIAAPATAALQTALNALATTPTTPSAITPSDATDTSTITAKGLLCTVAGTLQARGTGAPSTTVAIACVAGQYVPLQCSRVMAASTGTYVGLS